MIDGNKQKNNLRKRVQRYVIFKNFFEQVKPFFGRLKLRLRLIFLIDFSKRLRSHSKKSLKSLSFGLWVKLVSFYYSPLIFKILLETIS